jgi:uncharacterized protein (DUF305 family)
MVRRRLGGWLLVAMLAAGCATSDATQRPGSDHTDVWFAQHMVPHLLQTSVIVNLAGDQLTRPKLARLAGTINRQSHVHLQQLQGWLEGRGLAAYDPQQDPNHRKETDLSRLSRTHGAGFDRAFLKVMTARHRTGLRLAAAETRDGANPELRALAQQMTTELQAQLEQLTALLRV